MENSATGITQPSTAQFSTASNVSSVYLSQIVDKDKELLKSFVMKIRPKSQNYEDSWGYVIQATRHNGFKLHDSLTNSLIFFGRKSLTDNTLVVPLYFAKPRYLKSFIEKVQKTLSTQKTILKNVNPEDVTTLGNYGFRPYKKNEGWSEDIRFDDQTYPQSIVDLKKIVEIKGRLYHHLRKALRKNSNSSIRPYRKSDREDVLKIFALKDGNSKGMYYLSHAMYPDADIDKYVIVDNASKKIIGFTGMSDISPKNAAFVSLLFKPGIKFVGVWGIYQTLMLKYEQGYQKINFGGSETEGTYIFTKRTFRPIKELKKTHLTYDRMFDNNNL